MFDFDILQISDPDNEVNAEETQRDRAQRERTGVALDAVRLNAPVTDIPRGPALILSPEAAISTAVDSFRARRCGAAVVVQHHRPVGVVTDRDILSHAFGEIQELRNVPLASVMALISRPLFEGDTVGTALRVMCAQRQWHLPIVCERGLFVGALNVADIMLWLRDRMTLSSVDAAVSELGGQ